MEILIYWDAFSVILLFAKQQFSLYNIIKDQFSKAIQQLQIL